MKDKVLAMEALADTSKDEQPVAQGSRGVAPSAARPLSPCRKEVVEDLRQTVLGPDRWHLDIFILGRALSGFL